MTREDIEQINVVEPNCFETSREEEWYKFGLTYGLEIADENPKSPWISIYDDLPCNHDELMDYYNSPSITRRVIICNEYNQVDMGYMCKSDDKWVWIAFGTPKYWCKYPEPPKE